MNKKSDSCVWKEEFHHAFTVTFDEFTDGFNDNILVEVNV